AAGAEDVLAVLPATDRRLVAHRRLLDCGYLSSVTRCGRGLPLESTHLRVANQTWLSSVDAGSSRNSWWTPCAQGLTTCRVTVDSSTGATLSVIALELLCLSEHPRLQQLLTDPHQPDLGHHAHARGGCEGHVGFVGLEVLHLGDQHRVDDEAVVGDLEVGFQVQLG